MQKWQVRVGRGGRENAKFPHLYPVPSDGDPVASVGVSKVCTRSLVSIGYCAMYECTMIQELFYNKIFTRIK